VATKKPTPQGISALLRKAGYERSAVLSRASLRHRYTAGFHTRSTETEVYIGHRAETPLLPPSAARKERDKATALEMVGKYAEALRAAGWLAEVIHLAGPLVRVTPKENR
jgi:hypothetical protein